MARKILFGIIGIAMTALLAGSALIGLAAERAYEQILRDAQASAAGRYAIEGTFERGWLSSQAETRVRIQRPGGELLLPLQHEVVHGPLPIGEMLRGRSPFDSQLAVVDTRYHVDPAQLPELAKALGQSPLLRVTARFGFDRSVELLIHSPAIELEAGRFSSQGLRGEIDIRGDGLWVDGAIALGAVQFFDGEATARLAASTLEIETVTAPVGAGADESVVAGARLTVRLEMGEIRLDGKAMKIRIEPSALRISGPPGLKLAAEDEIELKLGQVSVTPTDGVSGEEGGEEEGKARKGGAIVLRGARLSQKGRRAPDSGLSGSVAQLAFAELEVGPNKYGPAHLDFAIRNIDTEEWESFRASMTELEQQGLGEQELGQARVMLLSEALPKVLGSSPEIAVERFEIVGPSGTFDATALFGVDGSDPLALANPFMLLSKLEATIKMAAPVRMLHALIENTLARTASAEADMATPEDVAARAQVERATLVEKLLADKTLVRDGDVYRLDARLQEGLPIINGVPADPTFLMGILPGF